MIKNLHEIKQESLGDFAGEVEKFCELSIGDYVRQKRNRIRNTTVYELYTNAIDQDSESEDAIYNGYIYKKDTPQFNVVHRSPYEIGCDFRH